jgi:hypothetical protein
VIDVVATAVLGILTLLAAGAALFASPFLLMATDSAGENPDLKPLGWAYVATWGGVIAGVVGAAVGVFLAARADRPMWIWPALGVVVIGSGFAIGGLLAIKTGRHAG